MSKKLKTNDKKMKSTNTEIVEYQVAIYIAEVDKNGNKTDLYFEKNFKSTDMLTNRRKAIDYFLLQKKYFLNESQIDFSSQEEQKIKNYKGYKSFSISLQVSDNNGNCFYIDGDEPSSTFEFLNYESIILKTDQNIDFILDDDSLESKQKILKENYAFFILN